MNPDSNQQTPGQMTVGPPTPPPSLDGGRWWRVQNRARSIAGAWAITALALLVVASLGFFYWYTHRPQKTGTVTGNFGTVTLKDLPNQATVGQSGQTLTFNADSNFGGSILANKDIAVKGNATLAGTTTAKDLQVVGSLSAGKLDVKSGLAVSSLSVQSLVSTVDLTASGNGSFGGSLSAGTINARNLTVTGHYVSAGQAPGVGGGTAVGAGGTVSISGNDTTGTVTINVGAGAPAGVLANVSFRTAYGSTPHVNLTPLSASAASLPYYVTRSTSSFTVNAATPPAPGTYSFDYFVAQ